MLLLNSGSSTIRYKLYDMPFAEVLAAGITERVDTDGAVLAHGARGKDALIAKTSRS